MPLAAVISRLARSQLRSQFHSQLKKKKCLKLKNALLFGEFFMPFAMPTSTPQLLTSTTQRADHLKAQLHPYAGNLPRENFSAHNFSPNSFQFKRHESLHFRRYGLWRIRSGHVRTLSWGLEGEAIPLGFWQEGDIVGHAIAQSHSYEANCLTAVTADYLGSDYVFSREVVLAQVRQSNDLLRISHCRQAEMRLLLFFCWLAQRFGKSMPNGRHIQPKLTHQEIAESIGITRVTVTRLIKVLELEGKIKWKAREKVVYAKTFEQFCQPAYGEKVG
jgi:CRP-like cAMP-binding protein